MNAYLIPAESVVVTEEIKKSRFITYLEHTDGVVEAKNFIQTIKHKYPDARHHCWAYVAGRPDDCQQLGFSDDGEPTGTAGKPMITQLLASHIGEISVVVVRYFGGIKLGTGGLVRAYGNSVQQALSLLNTQQKVLQKYYLIYCEYAHIKMVEQLIQQSAGQILVREYSENVILEISLPANAEQKFADKLRNLSRGALNLIPKS
ncbi:IMPACT family protein [Arsenophonus nasoniae]|uniref:IMPACT family member YigZ n=1 Tax=Arsenophonus nasoniae TaxID=638 RepID=A0A4P7L4J6_9GAMM|nr:IMPACT family protein [Arsenophonus nasoniae]QBY45164.1 IMPACT family member YigZ [Arsenophonus nasoniae]WGL95917.1 IMPACT family protein [Arsenophonus nasoniae]WGM01175.1 IMPACT family protein [Arsenophonus nasoniae]WGM05363.1 IMPACT family protein [Arsenophonus nasoniae]WGM10370.1 IMPACT family protein [Arsenophonus nasoniae]